MWLGTKCEPSSSLGKEALFKELNKEVREAAPCSQLTYKLRNQLERCDLNTRSELASRVFEGMWPMSSLHNVNKQLIFFKKVNNQLSLFKNVNKQLSFLEKCQQSAATFQKCQQTAVIFQKCQQTAVIFQKC